MRVCVTCKIGKELSQFHNYIKNGYTCYSKECITCRPKLDNRGPAYRREYRSKNPIVQRLNKRARREELRSVILSHYTNGSFKCACGCDIKSALHIDHVNNDGSIDRMVGVRLYRHIINNNFPESFQVLCANCNIDKQFKYNSELPKSGNRSAVGNRRRYNDARLKVLSHYSTDLCCCQCGENRIWVLQLDHKNGHGNKHRLSVGHTIKMYRWIINNDYPPLFQVLCANCNFSKRDIISVSMGI